VDLAEEGRVRGVIFGDDLDAEFGGQVEFGIDVRDGLFHAFDDGGGAAVADAFDALEFGGGGGEDGLGGFEEVEESGNEDGAQAWGEGEAEQVAEVLGHFGHGRSVLELFGLERGGRFERLPCGLQGVSLVHPPGGETKKGLPGVRSRSLATPGNDRAPCGRGRERNKGSAGVLAGLGLGRAFVGALSLTEVEDAGEDDDFFAGVYGGVEVLKNYGLGGGVGGVGAIDGDEDLGALEELSRPIKRDGPAAGGRGQNHALGGSGGIDGESRAGVAGLADLGLRRSAGSAAAEGASARDQGHGGEKGSLHDEGTSAGILPGDQMSLMQHVNGFRMLASGLWSYMKARPRTSATAGVAIILMGVGVWSCQTMPARPPLSTTASRDPASTKGEPEVRIRIRTGLQMVKLDGPRTFTLQRLKEPAKTVEGPLTIGVMADGVRISDGSGATTMFEGWSSIDVRPASDPAAQVRIDTNTYPGHLRILPKKAASLAEDPSSTAPGQPRLDVITLTPIEAYLVGVVAAELYPDWKAPGVFAVQAVCARTYALHERQRSIEKGQEWDLESSEQDQAYKGGTTKPEALNAVRDTRGVVMTYGGRLLRTYYSSTCGGRVAAASDVWPTGPGYEFNLAKPIQANHRESLCEKSPRYRWEVTRDKAAFSKQLRDWGKSKQHAIGDIGLFKSISVDKVNEDERPSRYTIVDGAGKKFSITADMLRTACNFKSPGAAALTTLVRSGDLDIEAKGLNVVIRGRGFGHGVGMCQFCAKAMAERGDTWQAMMVRFYPGAKIERAY